MSDKIHDARYATIFEIEYTIEKPDKLYLKCNKPIKEFTQQDFNITEQKLCCYNEVKMGSCKIKNVKRIQG